LLGEMFDVVEMR